MEIEWKKSNRKFKKKEILGIDLSTGCVLSTALSVLGTCMTIFTVCYYSEFSILPNLELPF